MRQQLAIAVAMSASFVSSSALAQQAVAAQTAAPAPTPAAIPPGGIDVGLFPAKSKWSLTLGGFLQLDTIYDTTQSFNDAAGGTLIQRDGTYAGGHDRVTFSMRNSRVNFRLTPPEVMGLRTTGFFEMDFLGNEPPTTAQATGGVTELQFFTSPTVRGKQVYLKVEDDYVDLLFGLTWHLFGWQPLFHPNTVEYQGVPGQLFARSLQFRLSHVFKTDAVSLEVAVAAVRPPQKDSGIPDGQGGVKLAVNGLKALHVAGTGGPQALDPLTIGVSGLVRQFRVVQFSATPSPTVSNTATGWGVSVDALAPIIPASPGKFGNSLSVEGSFQKGSGFADQYLAFTGGVSFPALPIPAGATTAPAFVPDVDPGYVTYDAQGQLHTIDWTVFLIGLQYYLPPSGNLWIAGNVSASHSDNIASFGANPRAVYTDQLWWDACLFWQPTAAVRFGAEFAQFKQTYADSTNATNDRAQLSGFFMF